MERNTYPEMNKLIRLLAKADIPFDVMAFPFHPTVNGEGDKSDGGLQIFAPSYENPTIDAVCHFGTYGYQNGLIEIMEKNAMDPVGWLTAEEAYEYFVKAVRGGGEDLE